jgi:hypothetical protein
MQPLIRSLTLLLSLLGSTNLMAATCSCSSVPLLGSMESGSPAQKSWFVGSRYEVHDISDLYSGSDEVNDETGRDRESQSLVVQLSYGINEQWAVTGLLSAVEQTRKVGQGSTTRGRGLSDGLVMVKYSPKRVGLFSRYGVSFGIGARIPMGDDDATDFVTLSEDLQPSTGAWSSLYWTHVTRSFSQSAKTQLYGGLSYSDNGENDRNYRFGNELSVSVGMSYQTDRRWGFSGDIHYRQTDRDERNSVSIPNTGGKWLDFIPAVQYHFTDKIAGKISARIPVRRDLNDALQFTTSSAFSLSVSYVL